ncbi:MAG: transposase [Caldilineaceae bacterium]|nr:transposase [Caldilineaceae bacterium]
MKRRKNSIRKPGYDYTNAGVYFVTICVQDFLHLLGAVHSHADRHEMVLNEAGQMVQQVWESIPQKFPTTALDEIIIMPNHIHLLLWLGTQTVGADPRVRPQAATGDDGQARGPAPTGASFAIDPDDMTTVGADPRVRPQDATSDDGQAQGPAPTGASFAIDPDDMTTVGADPRVRPQAATGDDGQAQGPAPTGASFAIDPDDMTTVGPDPRVRPQAATGDNGQAQGPAPTGDGVMIQRYDPALADVMAWFKSLTTAKYRRAVYEQHWTPYNQKLWQRSYYDHIVRSDASLNAIRHYICENPRRWGFDRYHPNPQGPDPVAVEIWRQLQAESKQFRKFL